MTIWFYISVILFLICILLIFRGYKLVTIIDELLNYKKQSENLFEIICAKIDWSDKKIKEIDYKGTFESDDEVGYFFKNLKEIQNILNEFIELFK